MDQQIVIAGDDEPHGSLFFVLEQYKPDYDGAAIATASEAIESLERYLGKVAMAADVDFTVIAEWLSASQHVDVPASQLVARAVAILRLCTEAAAGAYGRRSSQPIFAS